MPIWDGCDSLSSLGDSEVTEPSNNNTTDLSGMSRLQEKEEMIKSQVTSPPTVSPTMSQQRKVRAKENNGALSAIAIHLACNRRNCNVDMAERALLVEAPSTEDLQEIQERWDLSGRECQDQLLHS